MKKINTIISTGDTLIKGDTVGIVGTYLKGQVKITWKLNDTSGYSEYLSTKKLNSLLKDGTIILQDEKE